VLKTGDFPHSGWQLGRQTRSFARRCHIYGSIADHDRCHGSVLPARRIREARQVGPEAPRSFVRDVVDLPFAGRRPKGRHRAEQAAFGRVGLSLVFCIPQPKLKSYLELVLLLIVLLLYFQLRKSVRNVADAPDELLDERQIAIRNSGYLHAYRWLSALMLIYAVVFIGIYEIFLGNLNWAVNIKFTQPILAFCMWVACLPSMVLAWQLPTEQFIPEESK